MLATPVGDIEEVINEGETGFLTTPQDPAMLAERIKTLFLLPASERARIAANARQYIINHFSADAMAAQYKTLFHEL